MDFVELTPSKLSVESIMDEVAAPNCGAVSFFVGTTRDNFEGKKVVSLEYEAYESMAVKEMNKICTEMRKKWDTIENIAIHHRLGVVPVKEASVVIAVSSPHRTESMEATQWCIDTLKKTVPIWKKELYDDTESQWKANPECPWTPDNKDYVNEKRKSDIPKHLIQITCSDEEMNRRIKCFMKTKQAEVKQKKLLLYCGDDMDEDGCVRVNAKYGKRAKITNNLIASKGLYTQRPVIKEEEPVSCAVQERLENIEKKMNIIKPVNPGIYNRLKELEDRLLYLESISPEYLNVWKTNPLATELPKASANLIKKAKYSADDLDKMIWELEGKSVLL